MPVQCPGTGPDTDFPVVRKKPEDLAEKQRIPAGNRKLPVDVSPPLNPTLVPVPGPESNQPGGETV